MAELILGMGDTSSLAKIAEIAEQEVSRREGAARKIIITSRQVDIALVRPEIDEDFKSVTMRIKDFESIGKGAFEKALSSFQGKYNLETDGSYATLTYPAEDAEAVDGAAMDLLRQCSEIDRDSRASRRKLKVPSKVHSQLVSS